VAVVLVLMVLLYCTRGVAETVLGVLACVEACVGINVCEHCAYRNALQMCARLLLDVYFGLHPLLLVLLTVGLQSAAAPRVSSTLVCSMVLANASAHYAQERAPELDPRSSVAEVEYIMWVVPFALAMAACYMSLSRAFAGQDICEQSEWGEDVLQGTVFGYEVLYHLELFLMNLSLLGTSCSEQSLGVVVYGSATLTLLQAYFIAGSRTALDGQAHAVLNLLVAVLFVLVLMSVLAYVHVCVISRALGVVLLVCSCAVVLGHHACFGRAPVAFVVLLRLGITACASLAHIVVMCVGRNRVCGG
jgi:hypothetical protein